ncbi:hypothetical protein [Streptomyces goshikiensis]|uniref:hypothetical protein n=1 Tax=Streptomyces goshikiensis TaxID=1942 RepID=UPI00371E7786
MAVRHQLIRRSPREVWDVLADPTRYGEWVVGPSESGTLHYPAAETPLQLRHRGRPARLATVVERGGAGARRA